MRRHAKATPAGPTDGTGSSRGFVRRAFATRGAFSGSKGSGAPSFRFLAVLVLAIAGLLTVAAPALAGNIEVGEFAGGGPEEGGRGSADGQLFNPGQADVNGATGMIYVADTNNNRIQVFKPTEAAGEYDSQVTISEPTGLAIDQTTGDVYVSNAAGIAKFDEDLNPIVAPDWIEPAVTGTLAVDPSTDDLLVADQANNLIRRFEADGTAAGSFAATRPVDLAANSTGEIFVVTSTGDFISYECSEGANSAVERFSSAGVPIGAVGSSLEFPGAVAIDPDDDSIVIAAHVNTYYCEEGFPLPEIAFFDSSGVLLETVGLAGELGHDGEDGNALYTMIPGLTAQGGDSSRVYAVTRSPANDKYGATKIATLEFVAAPTIDPVDPGVITATEATFSGTVDPDGKLTSWHFEYSLDGGLNWVSTPTESAGSGEDPVDVSTTVGGLQPHLTYQVKLVARGVGSSFQSFITDTAPPTVETLNAVQVSDTGAVLRGRVNPNNQLTTYRFEIGETTAYGRTVPTGTEPSAGNGGAFKAGSTIVGGLAPGTVYHYRMIATNATGSKLGADQAFTAEAVAAVCPNEVLRAESHSLALPDCRAYEMVSPPDKIANDVIFMNSSIRAATDGHAATFSSSGAFAGSPGSPGAVPYLASRDSESWTTWATGAPQPPSTVTGSGFRDYNEDLSVGVRTYAPDEPSLVPGAPKGVINVYSRELPTGQYTLLSQADPGMPAPTAFNPWIAAISTDGNHVLFESEANLATGATGSEPKLYEAVNGQTRLAGILPADEGGGSASGSMAGYGAIYSYTNRAISRDGSRVFFTAPATEDAGQLYVRENGTSTTRVSAPAPGAPIEAEQPARYWTATPDGRYVFFTSAQKLVSGATATETAPDLYRYDVQSDDLIDLSTSQTGDPANVGIIGFGILNEYNGGVIGASNDGSRAYFVAKNQIITGEPDLPGLKLYRWDEGEGATYIATLDGTEDGMAWWQGNDIGGTKQSRLTPDGGRLLFTSMRQLDPDRDSGGEQAAYLYDADSDDITCISCPPDGSPSTAEATLGYASALSGSLSNGSGAEGFASGLYLPRFLSEDGSRAFFMTAQSLLPEDSNGVQDVYLWEGGKIYLISTGQSPDRSFFGDASADGSDVFIATRERLSGWDTDKNIDIYDARVGGGQVQPSPPGDACTGEACQGSGTAPPPTNAVATTNIAGAGNLKPNRPKPCAKPKKHKGKAKHKGKRGHKGKRAHASAKNGPNKSKPCKRVAK